MGDETNEEIVLESPPEEQSGVAWVCHRVVAGFLARTFVLLRGVWGLCESRCIIMLTRGEKSASLIR